MREFIHHLFVPRHSNNHRAKILHQQSLLIVVLFFVIAQFVFFEIKRDFSHILGTSSDIRVEELLLITNQKRQEQGLNPLVLNQNLSKAAEFKANDMFSRNYWAHNGPDGTTPWFYFNQIGYEYVYAGENLARGFTNSSEVIEAWLASPSHRDNVFSPQYQEIGFAVVDGSLVGESTTLVVEFFGKQRTGIVASKVEVPKATRQNVSTRKLGAGAKVVQSQTHVAPIETKPLIDSKILSFNISTIVLLFFIFTLLLDMIVIERKKIVRVVGHNLDHVFFLTAIFLFVTMFVRGAIL